MKRKIFCLILNYRRYRQTQTCLRALQRADVPLGTRFLIIDNSPRPKLKLLDKFNSFRHTSTLISPKNIGFSAGNNQGIKQALKAKATQILIINPDVTVPHSFFKPLLRDLINHHRTGLVAPAIKHYQNGHLRFGLEGQINWKFAKATHINLPKRPSEELRSSLFVTFACVLIDAAVFNKIGFLDERYFMYLEDVDYCLRAKKAGFNIYLDPSVTVTHQTSASFANPISKLPISFVSQVKFIFKWLTFPQTLIALAYNVALYLYLFFLWEYQFLKRKYL